MNVIGMFWRGSSRTDTKRESAKTTPSSATFDESRIVLGVKLLQMQII
jgi:hypothetical protein